MKEKENVKLEEIIELDIATHYVKEKNQLKQ